VKVACILSEVDDTTIPVENFIALDHCVNKTVVVYGKVCAESVVSKINKSGADFFYFESFVAFFLFLYRERFDVVHLHHSKSAFLVSFLSFFIDLGKLVLTVHNDFRYYKRINKIVFVFVSFLVDGIVYNSLNTKESFPFFSRKILRQVIYNGVNLQQVHESDALELGGEFIVGTASRLVPQKDHYTLLEGFARFRKLRPDLVTHLYIVGDGQLMHELVRLADNLEIGEFVHFVGAVDRLTVYSYIKSFDIFAVTSTFEGFCNAMVEAMACGRFLVVSNVAPLPEVLGDGHGLFFNVGDSADFAGRLVEASYEDRALFGRESQIFAQRYSLENCAAQHLNYYRKLIEL